MIHSSNNYDFSSALVSTGSSLGTLTSLVTASILRLSSDSSLTPLTWNRFHLIILFQRFHKSWRWKNTILLAISQQMICKSFSQMTNKRIWICDFSHYRESEQYLESKSWRIFWATAVSLAIKIYSDISKLDTCSMPAFTGFPRI